MNFSEASWEDFRNCVYKASLGVTEPRRGTSDNWAVFGQAGQGRLNQCVKNVSAQGW